MTPVRVSITLKDLKPEVINELEKLSGGTIVNKDMIINYFTIIPKKGILRDLLKGE